MAIPRKNESSKKRSKFSKKISVNKFALIFPKKYISRKIELQRIIFFQQG